VQPLAFVLLDGWMYLWHRLNHAVPVLWRFHRTHHADGEMDATTATRFHLGEMAASAALRLALVPLLGLRLYEVLLYDAIALVVAQLHHANISLGAWDGWLSWLVVTPGLHRTHHSRLRAECDSNFAAVLPVWDRLFGTLRHQPPSRGIGMAEFDGAEWKTLRGMLAIPFRREGEERPAGGAPAG
jgi:sterol desaturase/sphingolipid hydroxylase (fatty acid hydroxylase superfamily)